MASYGVTLALYASSEPSNCAGGASRRSGRDEEATSSRLLSPYARIVAIMPELTISYAISRASPAPTDPPANDTVSFLLDASSRQQHLASLQQALGDARAQMNDRLTEWKDVLKDVEKQQQKKNKKRAEDDADDDEDDEDLEDAE